MEEITPQGKVQFLFVLGDAQKPVFVNEFARNKPRRQKKPKQENFEFMNANVRNKQCQWAMESKDVLQCKAEATRKWGDHWFCEVHGVRLTEAKFAKDHPASVGNCAMSPERFMNLPRIHRPPTVEGVDPIEPVAEQVISCGCGNPAKKGDHDCCDQDSDS